MIEDSLSRSGKGGMNAAMKFADGDAATPSVTFTTEPNTGFFRTAGLLGLSVVGAIRASLTAALARFYTPVQMDSTLTVAGTTTLTGVATFTAKPVLSAGITGILSADLPATGEQVSASTLNFSTASAVYVDVTNAAVTITTAGRPVILMMVPETTVPGSLSVSTGVAGGGANFALKEGATIICEFQLLANANDTAHCPSFTFLRPVAAGTYTYKLQALTTAVTITAYVTYMKMVAYEL